MEDTNQTAATSAPKKRGRPPGQFMRKREALLHLLQQQPQPCRMTDKQMADIIGVCTRQVSRYLKSLKDTNFLKIEEHKHPLSNTGATKWSNTRSIILMNKIEG